MTASHQGDATVLKQMLPKKLKYIGMLGSKTTACYILNEMKKGLYLNRWYIATQVKAEVMSIKTLWVGNM